MPATIHSHRPPRVLSAGALISSFDRFALSPLLFFIATEMGVPLHEAVAIASSYFFAYGLAQLLWGGLADRVGKVRLLQIVMLGAGVAGLLSAVAPNLVLLTIARALTGFFMGGVFPTSITYVGDTIALKFRQPALADLMAAAALGIASATAVAGIVGDLFGWRWMFAIPAVAITACAFFLTRLTDTRGQRPAGGLASYGRALRLGWVWALVGLVFVEGALLLGILTFLAPALQAIGYSASVAGLTVTAYGVSTLLSTRLVRSVASKLGRGRMMLLGGASATIGYAILGTHVSLLTVLVCSFFHGVAWAFMHSSFQTWATEISSEHRSTVVSLFVTALFSGSAVGATAGGVLATADAWQPLFWATSAALLVLTMIAVFARGKYENR